MVADNFDTRLQTAYFLQLAIGYRLLPLQPIFRSLLVPAPHAARQKSPSDRPRQDRASVIQSRHTRIRTFFRRRLQCLYQPSVGSGHHPRSCPTSACEIFFMAKIEQRLAAYKSHRTSPLSAAGLWCGDFLIVPALTRALRASASATAAPVIAAVRVPPSA